MTEPLEKAENFLLTCIRKGLAHSFDTVTGKWVKPYPEVTGYLLSYFAKNAPDAPMEIFAAAKKLAGMQHPSGGFPSFFRHDILYTFDTAQILHGFASLYKWTKENRFLERAQKCADFILDMQLVNGALFPMFDLVKNAKYVEIKGGTWGTTFSFIQVKNIEGLCLLQELTGDDRYKQASEKLVGFGKKNCDLTYTHPGAYCLEGMWAIGEHEFVAKKLKEQVIGRIEKNGFLPYGKDLSYSYVSGSVQMAILLFKTGFKEQATLIREWVKKVQSNHESGGLFQYANKEGQLDSTVHSEINSWGTKYFCELERLFL